MTSSADPAPPKRATRLRSLDPAFEVSLGARIRAARTAAGMSQSDLGRAVGVSFQQVQKYENGRDRLAVTTLRALAEALGVELAHLVGEGAPTPGGKTTLLRAAMAVAADWQRIRSPDVRRRIAALVAAVAEAKETEGGGEVDA